jgi:hypothetical protein
MDPSEENAVHSKPMAKKKQFILPAILIILLLVAIGGILAFFNSSSTPPLPFPEQEQKEEIQTVVNSIVEQESETEKSTVISTDPTSPVSIPFSQDAKELGNNVSEEQEYDIPTSETNQRINAIPAEQSRLPHVLAEEAEKISVCSQPEERLKAFYTHLDNQPYMESYHLTTSSQDHFAALIKKLLDNPPEITRESDDLYTILKNTAHFFRISGKDNIIMLQGILNSEKDKLEQILADYYLLVTTPECSSNQYVDYINRDALYEYACFFLNTMGGRLYLFRRDSLSRINVTYYAILLVDLANLQQNNRHGIALKTAINMLISEMERGGSSLKGIEEYLDKLYDLKEKYQ